jgi:hypothetical protein
MVVSDEVWTGVEVEPLPPPPPPQADRATRQPRAVREWMVFI